jgi:hypothetical protein
MIPLVAGRVRPGSSPLRARGADKPLTVSGGRVHQPLDVQAATRTGELRRGLRFPHPTVTSIETFLGPGSTPSARTLSTWSSAPAAGCLTGHWPVGMSRPSSQTSATSVRSRFWELTRLISNSPWRQRNSALMAVLKSRCGALCGRQSWTTRFPRCTTGSATPQWHSRIMPSRRQLHRIQESDRSRYSAPARLVASRPRRFPNPRLHATSSFAVSVAVHTRPQRCGPRLTGSGGGTGVSRRSIRHE